MLQRRSRRRKRFARPTNNVAFSGRLAQTGCCGTGMGEFVMKRHLFAFAAATAIGLAPAGAQPASIDAHLAAAKRAAGFDFPGLLAALCVAPRNAPTPDVKPGPPPPDRMRWYTEPAKVFDDVYFVGTKDRSSWALTTPDGIILIDTTFEYEAEDVIVGGLRKLGFDPASVKYVIITHAHPGEVGGAKLMQERFGSRIVIGEGDWEMIEQSVNRFPNGKPKRDIIAQDGQMITLGGRSVTLMLMPGHTPGTVSMIFEVKDNSKPLTVAFSGGTEFNFVNDVAHFDTYISSARKFAAAAAAAGATVLMTNQSEFDNAASKIRMLAARRPGEPHPLEVGRDAVQRYFKVFDECAQVARIKLLR
jgi:metallo-beta-lactamase class B